MKAAAALTMLFLSANSFAALNLAVEANPDPVAPGARLDVTITVSNDAATASGDVTVLFRYPDQLQSIDLNEINTGGADNSVSCVGDVSPGACGKGEAVTFSLGRIPAGGGTTVRIPAEVGGRVADGEEIVFDVQLQENGLQQSQVNALAVVQSQPVYDLVVRVDANPVAPGEQLTYTIAYGNVSNASTSNTQLAFSLPAGTSFVSATGNASLVNGDVVWQIGSLADGAGTQEQVVVQVQSGTVIAGNLLATAATLTGEDAGFTTQRVRATRVTRVQQGERPQISVNLQRRPVVLGTRLPISITVTNPTGARLDNVELVLTYPEALTSMQINEINTGSATNTVSCVADVSPNACGRGELVTLDLSNIPAGSGVTVILPSVVRARIPAGSIVAIDAEVRVNGVQQVHSADSVVAKAAPFFTLTLQENTEPVAADEELTYTLNYGNAFTSDASDVELTLSLPPEVSFITASNRGAFSNGEVKWRWDSLGNGVVGTQSVNVRVESGLIGNGDLLRATARLTGMDAGFTTRRAESTRSTRVRQTDRPGLRIATGPQPVEPGDALPLRMIVSNTSSTSLNNVELILHYPDAFLSTDIDEIDTGGATNTVSCMADVAPNSCGADELVTFNLSNIPAGNETTVRLPVDISGRVAPGSLIPLEAEVRVNGSQRTYAARTVRLGEAQAIPDVPGGGGSSGSSGGDSSGGSSGGSSSGGDSSGGSGGSGSGGDSSSSSGGSSSGGNGSGGSSGGSSSGGGVIALTIDEIDRGQYGWRYGTSRNSDKVSFSFQGGTEDLLLTVKGFDIDSDDEVSVWLNDAEIKRLRLSRNNALSSLNRILLSTAQQVPGSNTLEFRQINPGSKYGVTSVRLRPVVGPPIELTLGRRDRSKYGYRYSGNSLHPGIIPFTFEGGVEDLFIKLVGFDIDTDDEATIWLNNTQIGALRRGKNLKLAGATRLPILLSDQIAGTNRLEVRQRKVGNAYGVTNATLQPLVGPVVTLTSGEKDRARYGYRYAGNSSHPGVLRGEFARIDADAKLSVRGFDIDDSAEVSVFLNGDLLGNLATTPNRGERSSKWVISQSIQQDTNVVEFRQNTPGERWGVRNLFIRPNN